MQGNDKLKKKANDLYCEECDRVEGGGGCYGTMKVHKDQQMDGRGGSSFFPRGGFDPSSTSRVAASRFFFWLFYEPRSGEPIFLAILRAAKRRADFFLAILRAAKRRADYFWLFYEPRSGEPIFFGYFTSREAASRFFLAILRAAKRRADFFLAILRAAKRRADFFWLFYEPRSGEPIFWTPVSDVFLVSTNAMETMITSLAAQGGGGGVKP